MATVNQILQQAEQTWGLTHFDLNALLAHVIKQTPTWLKTWPEHSLTPSQEKAFQHLCVRRAQAEPLAYLLGEWAFWSFNLQVTPATLIPRPETEHLVEWVLENFDGRVRKVLDLGTGSGAIALALALERPNWQLTATDISTEALTVAKHNALSLRLTHISWCESNWFDNLPQESTYHIIISNPPYIAPFDPHLLADGLPFEPITALVAADNGLADLTIIIEQGRQRLVPQGWLVVEHGYNQAAAVRELFSQYGYQNIKTKRDYGEQERFTYGQVG